MVKIPILKFSAKIPIFAEWEAKCPGYEVAKCGECIECILLENMMQLNIIVTIIAEITEYFHTAVPI